MCETKKEKLFQRVKQIRNDQTARAQALNILPNSSPQQRPSSRVITFFLFPNNLISLSDFTIGLLSKNLITKSAKILSKIWKVPEELDQR